MYNNRTIFFEDDDFKLSYEIINGYLFVHVTFQKATKAIVDKIKQAWTDFLMGAYFDGFEEIFTYTKDPRIINIVGGATEIKEAKTNKQVNKLGLKMFKWDISDGS